MAFAMLFVFWIWIYQVRLLMALFLGWSLTGTLDNFFGVLFSTQEGLLFLLVGHVVGAFLALFLFSITVVSIPLLLERDVDFVTAIVTSLRAVAESPVVMLGWGCAVTLIFIAGCLPASWADRGHPRARARHLASLPQARAAGLMAGQGRAKTIWRTSMLPVRKPASQ